jgi:arylsulfatase A
MKKGNALPIMMRSLGRTAIVFALLMMTPIARAYESSKENVILFLIDDMGWRDLGCQGSDYYQTPNIDALAREGVRFTQAYSACAVCSPTRAAILTGKYPARLLLTDWLPAGRWNPKSQLREGRFVRGLPVEEWSLAEAFHEAGYRTACIGKWHLGSEPFSLPEHHGFDINVGGNAHGAPGSFFYPYEGDWLIPGTDHKAKWNVLPDGSEGEYLTDRLTDEAVHFIRDNQDRPFFLYFPHYGVHTPIQAKPGTATRYEQIPEDQRQGMPEYAAMVQSIDESVGRVIHLLDELQLAEKTTVVFTSDNGGFWKATRNAPLRANKGAYYEGGIRVPLIIRCPGMKQRGLVIDEPVISNDLYPTCLSVAGLQSIPNQHLDGLDLGPLIRGETKTLDRPALYWHYPHYNEHPSSVPSSVIRKGQWKLIETFDPEGLELYDLEHDIGESTNLALIRPEKTAELHQELIAWRTRIDAEMMRPNPNYDPASKPARKKKNRE